MSTLRRIPAAIAMAAVAMFMPLTAVAHLCASVFSPSPFVSEQIRSRDAYIDPRIMVNPQGPLHGPLRYTRINLPEGARLAEAQIFREPSDLIVGVDTTGATKGHFYVIANGVRFDGRLFYVASSKRAGGGGSIREGLVLRYRNLPEDVKESLLHWMNSEEAIRGATCVAATCKLLFERGRFEGPSAPYLMPQSLVRHLIETTPLAKDGEPLPFEIYTINRDFKTFWGELPSWRTVPRALLKVLVDPRTWHRAGAG